MPSLMLNGPLLVEPSLNNVGRRYLMELPQSQLEPFFQSWLFFGLLHEILQDSYRLDDFIATSLHGGQVITTAKLLSHLREWEHTIQERNTTSTKKHEHLCGCLKLTRACLGVEFPAFDNDLRFQLASVSELIGYAINKAFKVVWIDDPGRSLTPINWGDTTSQHHRQSLLLERSNCCPSHIQMLINDFGTSPQALGFVATCFQDEYLQPRHASCDESKCQAGGRISPHQVPCHVSESCNCESFRVDEGDLADCLTKGCLPLLRVKDEHDLNQLTVEVVESTDSKPYVAFSHVCADGLGNSTATALPRCQIARLKTLVNNIDFEYLPIRGPKDPTKDASQMLLWCDTLCCPVESKEAKKIALTQLYRTYEDAFMVLVLDGNLVSHPRRTDRVSVEEACLRIATSRWITRLWTLQEGALPARKKKL
ncbi:MAG: hypothetical protein L6R41_008297 [Letrouitia leprolyta]|nr:MAG: hypothetical protein L6R41_008297 [Letrouitia leprolyta]